ncbi:threonine aldolase [Neokomagataea thailandica NBRC 106555]|uniref:Aromatic amino acid beta-eliminating lyase/threonine aldolase domain-containing protein n=2 Tax=Neokomagataea TaxID=1223423 RepID=A0A4Y6V624_9PROT|nr:MULTISPECIES: beta-eliminating lyase-related protein [Neokomagataea]QDH25499.1 hypothetical protein D5366_10065 [Neokomagataea tanensis]GBR52201.1 threonine aldolase [Neokomagataea thailandica NBRC 106555]
MQRRELFSKSAAIMVSTCLPGVVSASASTPKTKPPTQLSSRSVTLFGDTAPLSPLEQIAYLHEAASDINNPEDLYLKNGAVSALEKQIADLFGKTDAVFFPTGTMANNVAVRLLADEQRLVLTQQDSHLYADESDAAQILSGLNLVPMAPGLVNPSPESVRLEIESWKNRPYPVAVGAISLESPVRRHNGAYIPFKDLEQISSIAGEQKIGMHWDGSRSLLLYGIDNFNLQKTASLFDTIMVSLDKYLGAPTGAMLIGERTNMEKARHLRHLFGGLLHGGWQLALPPLINLPKFQENYLKAQIRAKEVVQLLCNSEGFTLKPINNGSNILPIQISEARLQGLKERLTAADIYARISDDGKMDFYTNLSILRRPPAEIARAFLIK